MQAKKLFYFNVTLIGIGLLTAISGIILEIIHGENFLNLTFRTWVWIHLVCGLLCSMAVAYHLCLHGDMLKQWIERTAKLYSKMTKWVILLSLITFFSGIIAMIPFFTGTDHHTIGGVHGKFGFILILLTFLHIKKRFGWFTGRINGTSFVPAIDTTKCIRCGLCVKKCPSRIFSKEDKQIRLYHLVNCIQCRRCISNCPKSAISGSSD